MTGDAVHQDALLEALAPIVDAATLPYCEHDERWWRHQDGSVHCESCKPPVMPSAVLEWIDGPEKWQLFDAQADAHGGLIETFAATSKPADLDQSIKRSDLGNAERLVAEHGSDLRFAPGLGWFAWDGRRWKRDVDGEVMRRAKRAVRSMYAAAADLEDSDDRKKLTTWALQSESEARLRAAASLAETEREVIVPADALDADPWLFNAANGTIDLHTGALREHRREDLLTRITPVVFDNLAEHHSWDAFLARITGNDAELAGFLRRAAGYTLTGRTSEEVLFFAHGSTATGKSTTLEALRAALGEYATTADFESFLKRRGDAGIRNDIARLAGARFVVSMEVDDGKALAEGLLKLLTGGDTVAARFLYRETFEFQPMFKLWLAANERPRVNADDSAIWRRIIQIPFVNVIPEAERDERVKLELRTSPQAQSAVLTWAVRGCLEWQEKGLAVPQSVRDYTAEYRAENDLLRDWLADYCELDAEAYTSNASLRESYEKWCGENGEKLVSSKTFAKLLRTKGCSAERKSRERGWLGVRVTDDTL
jgi:putative DNA primase/helicase